LSSLAAVIHLKCLIVEDSAVDLEVLAVAVVLVVEPKVNVVAVDAEDVVDVEAVVDAEDAEERKETRNGCQSPSLDVL